MRPTGTSLTRIVRSVAMLIAATTVNAAASTSAQALRCDLSSYTAKTGVTANISGDLLILEWEGAGDEWLRMGLGIADKMPVVAELAIRVDQGDWAVVVTDARFEFKIVEGFRRISNQQLVPLRELGVELTQEVVDHYKWDAFWDAPLDLREPVRANNPPPAEGVAEQPGLPRTASEIRRADAVYDTTGCRVTREGRRLAVMFPGMRLGSFSGELVLTVHQGTNLIRVEALASTDRPSVAYKYDVGLTGLERNDQSRVTWRDVGSQWQSYALRGPANTDHMVLRAANRVVVAETNGAAIAAFPPPHTFFWAREVEINVGNNWYRKDNTRRSASVCAKANRRLSSDIARIGRSTAHHPARRNTWRRTSTRRGVTMCRHVTRLLHSPTATAIGHSKATRSWEATTTRTWDETSERAEASIRGSLISRCSGLPESTSPARWIVRETKHSSRSSIGCSGGLSGSRMISSW